jgi:hypothetical protein
LGADSKLRPTTRNLKAIKTTVVRRPEEKEVLWVAREYIEKKDVIAGK